MKYTKTYFVVVADSVRRSVESCSGKEWFLRTGSAGWKLFWKQAYAALDYLKGCTCVEDAAPELELLRLYALSDRPDAKMLYGSALLESGKPWYDAVAGMRELQEGAVKGISLGYAGAWCMFIYGLSLLSGKHCGRVSDEVALWWMDAARRDGLPEAGKFMELYRSGKGSGRSCG